jgi:hypothetical protein
LLNKKKIQIIILWIIVAIMVCTCSFILQILSEKRAYTSQLNNKIMAYMQQQNFMLQRLGSNILSAIKQKNIVSIQQSLSAYEEVFFALSKHNLAVPITVNLVSLNAVQQIVGSFGILESNVLAPDEEYYSKIVEEPSTMTWSHLYIKQEMPDYPMFNFGLGIADPLNNYYGHLDVKIAASAFYAYIQSNLGTDYALFAFKTMGNNILQPEVYIAYPMLWVVALKYMLLRLFILGLISGIFWGTYTQWQRMSKLNRELQEANSQLNIQQQSLARLQASASVQAYYGKLLARTAIHAAANMQLIDLQSLVSDVKTVNVELAIERGVEIIFPTPAASVLHFYGHKLRLMQILSGMLCAIICQMKGNGKIDFKVELKNQQVNSELVFIFNDNGFYNGLEERDVEPSMADIRCQSWTKICDLIELEGGALEHVHTAYVGNTISLRIPHKVVNNVVNLENYYA